MPHATRAQHTADASTPKRAPAGGAPPGVALRGRLAGVDWAALEAALAERGHARIPELLTAGECRALRSLYADADRFRKRVDLGRQRFGERGDYQYFGYPLPTAVRSLRSQLYARLVPVANRWQRALGRDRRFPTSHSAYIRECRKIGQRRPTPLLLRYDAGGCNYLHQDLYGPEAFPLQVVLLLSQPGRDFDGGEFLLAEQRPRRQVRAEAIALRCGEALVFPNAERPVLRARGGHGAARMRHGVSRLHRGERFTLGLIFHDAV